MAIDVTAAPYRADPTGRTPSTNAFRAALAAAGQFGAVYVPAGTYRLTDVVGINRWQRLYGDGNSSVLLIDHKGDGILADGTIGPTNRHRRAVIQNLRFDNTSGNHPTFIAVQHSENLLVDNVTAFDVDCTSVVDNRFSYGLRIQNCAFITCRCTQALYFRESGGAAGDFSTTIPHVVGTDISDIAGNGIVFDGAAGAIRDTVIEGCTGDGLVLCANPALMGMRMISLNNIHFESNVGYHLRDLHPGDRLWATVTGCIFYMGEHPSRCDLNGRYVFDGCVDDSTGVTLSGSGSVKLRNSRSIAQRYAPTLRVIPEGRTNEWSEPAGFSVPKNLQGLNVNGGYGGGAALVLVTAQDKAGDGTVAEMFLIRYGFDGNRFEATSVHRSAGSSDVRFRFSVTSDGLLHVAASSQCTVKYEVVTQMGSGETWNY
jgi:hypothetical protein